MRKVMAILSVLALTLVVTAGCSQDEPAGSDGSQETRTIEVAFDDGSVTPNGERVEVAAGQPVELVVKASEPGTIHVHSTPEQELEYGAGTTTLKFTIDTPGVVDVESHDLEVTIVQLEVR